MPGRLAMETAIDSSESNHPLKEAPHSTVDAGEHAALTNGTGPSQASPVKPGVLTNGIAATSKQDEPPALDTSWRSTDGNKPLGKLLTRMAQGCYTDLQELVTKLNEEPVADTPATVNGAGPVHAEDTDPASVKKKRLLLDFAGTWRERFVKALVISDWSRTSGDDVAKIIDLRATLMDRVVNINQAVRATGDLKRDTIDSRMPAPNLKGAMQYLRGAKSTYPDLGVLQQPPLSIDQIMDLLQEMDTTANLRLCLNEPAIPDGMSEYTIANGRVTFKCPGFFELDLACLDQNPETSPWYFIDFRYDFSPAPAQISDQLRMFLEGTINGAAATSGLQGCYDFCHAYVLDQKIAEIESQAHRLARQRWSGCLLIQRLRRIVTIQYWTRRRSAKKSWLEFGITSPRDARPGEREEPHIRIRWFRDGELTSTDALPIDWTTIDLESFLLQVAQTHATSLLECLQTIMLPSASSPAHLSLQLETAEADAYRTQLIAAYTNPHPACPQPVSCGFGPYTGSISLLPRSASSRICEDRINADHDPTKVAVRLMQHICNTFQDGLVFETQSEEWTRVQDMLPLPVKAHRLIFGDAQAISFWTPSTAWTGNVLACSTSLSRQAWHVIGVRTGAGGREFVDAEEVKVDNVSWDDLLKAVSSAAVEQVQYKHLTAQAKRAHITFTTETSKRKSRLTRGGAAIGKLYSFDSGPLMQQSTIKPWIQGRVALTAGKVLRLADGADKVQHELRLTARHGCLAALRAADRSIPDIVTNDTGGIAVRVDVSLGPSLLDAVEAALRTVYRLDRVMAVTKNLKMTLNKLSMHYIDLSYGDTGNLAARLTYSNYGARPVKLTVNPADTNPHHRIRHSLQQLLNTDRADSFVLFAHILLLTLPLLQAVEAIEASTSPGQGFTFHVRHATWFSLKYKGSSSINFSIRARSYPVGDKHVVRWHLEREQQRMAAVQAVPEALTSALREFWNKPDLPSAVGLRTGIATDAMGVAGVVKKLHEIVSPHVRPPDTGSTGPAEQAKTAEKASDVQDAKTKQDIIMLD